MLHPEALEQQQPQRMATLFFVLKKNQGLWVCYVFISFFFCTKSDRLATFHQAGMKNVSLLLSLCRSPSLSPVPVPFLLSLLSFCSCPCTSVPLPVPLSLSLPRFGNETIYKTDYRGREKCSLEMKLQD